MKYVGDRRVGNEKKLRPDWLDRYEIVSRVGEVTYLVRDRDGVECDTVVNARKLRRVSGDPDDLVVK